MGMDFVGRNPNAMDDTHFQTSIWSWRPNHAPPDNS
jgi:hypothetical protein